jgi:TonB family protein
VTDANFDNQPVLDGNVDIPVRVVEGWGICIADISPISSTDKLPPMTRIIAIDSTPIKGVSIDEVRALLRGPAGHQVSLEVRTMQDSTMNIIYERRAVSNRRAEPEPAYLLWQASNSLDSYDENDVPSKYQSAIHSCERAGLEPITSALAFAAICVSPQWFDEDNLLAFHTLTQAASHFDKVGRFDDADQAISKAAVAAKKIEKCNGWELRLILTFTKQLINSGRTELAKEVFQDLIAHLEQSNGLAERTISALRPYADFLVSLGDYEKAETQFDRIVDLATAPNQYNELLSAADFYFHAEAFEKAIACYQNFIRTDKVRSVEMNRQFFQDRPLLHAYYKLACAQQKSSQLDAAKKTLEDATSYYTSRADESTQIAMERLPLFFPTLSDIKVKLAELFLQNDDDISSAMAFLNTAIDRIEKALGKEARSLKNALAALSIVYAKQGNTMESAALDARANSLKPVVEVAVEKKVNRHPTIRRGYDAIKSQDDIVTFEVVDELLDVFGNFSIDEEHQRASTQAWNCLSNFGKFLIEQQNFESANKLFERMFQAHSSHGAAPSTLLNSIKTERAIFSEQLGIPAEECWQELESSLVLQKAPKAAKVPSNDVSDQGLSVPEKLRRWALAYYRCGDLTRADAILKRAEHRNRSSATATAQPSSLQQNQLLLADIALTEIALGKFLAAKTTIEKDVSKMQHLPSIKVLQLAASYLSCGKFAEAENLLLKGIESNINLVEKSSFSENFIPQAYYRWKLARLYLKQSNTSAAGKFVDDAMNFYKSVRPPVALLVFAGDLSCLRHNHIKGVEYYRSAIEQCGSFGSSVFGQDCYLGIILQIAERAFAAQKETDELTTEERGLVFKQLADCVSDKDWELAISLYQTALKLFPETNKTCVEIAQRLSMLSVHSKSTDDQNIELKKQAAITAENAANSNTYYLWLQLADYEVSVGKIEQGISHIRHALQQFAKDARQPSSPNFHALLSSKSAAISILAKSSKTAMQAEILLKEAANVVSTVYGADSCEYSVSLVELARFYFDKREDHLAAQAMDTVIENYVANDAQVPVQSHQHSHPAIKQLHEISTNLAKRGELAKAASLISRILKIQREKLPSNNIQIAETLNVLGSLYRDAKDFERAEPCYREAIAIKTEHYGNGRILSHWISEYALVLRKLGRNEEAQALETIHVDHNDNEHTISMKVSKLQSDARRFESQREFDNAHGALLEAWELARQDKPFAHTAVHALETLCDYYMRMKNSESTAQVCQRLMDIYDAGAITAMPTRSKYILMLAKLKLDKGQTDGVAVLIKKARKLYAAIYVKAPFYMYILCAELEVQAGMYDQAIEDLEAAEQSLNESSEKLSGSLESYVSKLVQLWRKLGREDKSDAIADRFGQSKLSEKDSETPPSAMADAKTHSQSQQLEAYLRELEKKIKSCWISDRQLKEIRINFRIRSDGYLTNLALEHSSGNAQADIAAIRTIQNAAPFFPLPPGAGQFVKLQFRFDLRSVSGRILDN